MIAQSGYSGLPESHCCTIATCAKLGLKHLPAGSTVSLRASLCAADTPADLKMAGILSVLVSQETQL